MGSGQLSMFCNPKAFGRSQSRPRFTHGDRSIATDRCTTCSEKEISLDGKNRVWKALYIRAQSLAKRNTGNRPD